MYFTHTSHPCPKWSNYNNPAIVRCLCSWCSKYGINPRLHKGEPHVKQSSPTRLDLTLGAYKQVIWNGENCRKSWTYVRSGGQLLYCYIIICLFSYCFPFVLIFFVLFAYYFHTVLLLFHVITHCFPIVFLLPFYCSPIVSYCYHTVLLFPIIFLLFSYCFSVYGDALQAIW